jgi:hypothetical protein
MRHGTATPYRERSIYGKAFDGETCDSETVDRYKRDEATRARRLRRPGRAVDGPLAGNGRKRGEAVLENAIDDAGRVAQDP